MPFLYILILLVLSIACSNDIDPVQSTNIEYSNLYDYKDDDTIEVIELTNRGKSTSVYDKLIQVNRNNTSYLSTMLFSEQGMTDDEIGSITPLTTILSYSLKDSNSYLSKYVIDVSYFSQLNTKLKFTYDFYDELSDSYNVYLILHTMMRDGIDIEYSLLEKVKSNTDYNIWINDLVIENSNIEYYINYLIKEEKLLYFNGVSKLTLSNIVNAFNGESIVEDTFNLMDHVSSDIYLSDDKLTLNDNIELDILTVNRLFINDQEYQSQAAIYNEYITNEYYTLDNTITISNNITQLTNTFIITDFDSITGNTIFVDNIILDGNLLEPIINYYTLDNTIHVTNNYTLDNTIHVTNNYTLDNTITNNITQLTNTFVITDFDTITGNSVVTDNIVLDGNLLEPTITNQYYTLDNTVTNNFYTLDNTITNISLSNVFSNNLVVTSATTNITFLDNTITQIYDITQLTNTFIITDFDTITGNTLITDNIILDGNLLEPVINNYTLDNTIHITNNYTLDNTVTNNITQLTNTFVITDFDSISGNTIVSSNIHAGNLFVNNENIEDKTNTMIQQTLSTNLSLGNTSLNNLELLGYLNSNVIPSTNNIDLGSIDNPFKNVYAYDIILMSDNNLKNDINDLEYGLQDVLKLRPRIYRMPLDVRIGLIAQEVEEVLPEVVSGGKNKAVSYNDLIPVLINAIKEQQKKIEELEELVLDKIED